MRRRSFRRDFEDIHGRGAYAEVEVSVRRPMTLYPAGRLVLGALGLFWSVVLGGALLVAGVIAWAFLSSL